jgi:hypothetical protein
MSVAVEQEKIFIAPVFSAEALPPIFQIRIKAKAEGAECIDNENHDLY